MIKYEHHRSLKNGCFYNENIKNIISHPHIHHSFEYVTITSGKLKIVVSNTEFILSQNDSMFVLPRQIHSYEAIDGFDCTIDIIIFAPNFLPELNPPHNLDCVRTPLISKNSDAPTVSDIIKVTTDTFLMKAILYELAAIYAKGKAFKGNPTSLDEFGGRVIDYIETHYKEPISLRTIANHFGYNYRYLSGVINRCFNTSFTNLISEHRVSYACKLLRETDLPITEICFQTGFETTRSFNRIFKQFSGCSPKEYRLATK